MTIFKDRMSAGKLLAKKLNERRFDRENTIVIGIPRGGVVVAFEIARELKLKLDLVITRKIGAPSQKELSMGAVDPSGEVVWETALMHRLKLEPADLKDEIELQKAEIKRREREYRGNNQPLDVTGKVVLLVDDGIATGATILSAVRYLKKMQVGSIILVAPVVATEIADMFKNEVEELVVLHISEHLNSVGSFYQDFSQVSDEEVIKLLNVI